MMYLCLALELNMRHFSYNLNYPKRDSMGCPHCGKTRKRPHKLITYIQQQIPTASTLLTKTPESRFFTQFCSNHESETTFVGAFLILLLYTLFWVWIGYRPQSETQKV